MLHPFDKNSAQSGSNIADCEGEWNARIRLSAGRKRRVQESAKRQALAGGPAC